MASEQKRGLKLRVSKSELCKNKPNYEMEVCQADRALDRENIELLLLEVLYKIINKTEGNTNERD